MMKDCRAHLESLRQQVAESAFISALATLPHKQAMFAKFAAHSGTLAAEVERAMAAAEGKVSGTASGSTRPDKPNSAQTGPRLGDRRMNSGEMREAPSV